MEHFDLHPRHVDAGRAIAPAALATHAQGEGLLHRRRVQAVASQLPAQREAQGVGPATREVTFVAGDPKTRTHRAGIELAAVPVVVAHLDGLRQSACGIAAGPRGAGALGHRVGLHVPAGPVQPGRQRCHGIARLVPEQAGIVHSRRPHDLAGIHQVVGIEEVLDLFETAGQALAELPGHPFAADQAIAVLARERALVPSHQNGGLLGDGAHLRRAAGRPRAAHVQDRTDMQRADRGVGIPGPARAVTRKDFGEPGRVFREVLQRHCAVLDEADGLAVALQGHHDVQARLADIPQRFLRRRVRHRHHRAGQAEVRHQFHQRIELRQQTGPVFTAELHQQDRFGRRRGRVDQCGLHHRPEHRVAARQVDHGAVHQLHRRRSELDDMLRAVHCAMEVPEVDDPEHLVRGQAGQLQLQALEPGQSAFGPHQQVGQVDRAVRGIGPFGLRMEHIEVVAAHPPQDLGPAPLDLVLFALGDLEQARHQFAGTAAAERKRGVPAERAELLRCCRLPAGPRCRARCEPCCRRQSTGSRRSCCRPCRRWSPGPRSTRPPGTRARAAAARR